jgi:RNA polymerase sigma factor (sigma-70 family)
MMAPTPDYSFEQFFEAQYPGICRALWLGLGENCEPEDAAQEAFARAFQKWSALSRLERPATWVFVVAVRQARRNQRRRDRSLKASLRATEPLQPTESAAFRLTVVTALGRLAPRQRLAIVLRYYADLSVRDIAKAMNCREGTVKATIHSAHDRLRTRWRNEVSLSPLPPRH